MSGSEKSRETSVSGKECKSDNGDGDLEVLQSDGLNTPDVATPSTNDLESEVSSQTTDSTVEMVTLSSSSSDSRSEKDLNNYTPIKGRSSVRFDKSYEYVEKRVSRNCTEMIQSRSPHRNWFEELPEDLQAFTREWVRSVTRIDDDGEQYIPRACERICNTLVFTLSKETGDTVFLLDTLLREIFHRSFFDVVPGNKVAQKVVVFSSLFANAWGTVGRTIYPTLRRNMLLAAGVHQFPQIYREIQIDRDTLNFYYPGQFKYKECTVEQEKLLREELKSAFQNTEKLPVVTITGSPRSIPTVGVPSKSCLRAPVTAATTSSRDALLSTTSTRNSTNDVSAAQIYNLIAAPLFVDSTVSIKEIDGTELERVPFRNIDNPEVAVALPVDESISNEPPTQDEALEEFGSEMEDSERNLNVSGDTNL